MSDPERTRPEAPGPRPVGVYVSLGSNVGDRHAALAEALKRLKTSGHAQVTRQSSLYETAAVGKTDQPAFLNLVAEIETDLAPDALLDLTQSIEHALGRTRNVRWGPRTIDIDILLYGDRTIRSARLTVPHPEMARRRFVLEPLLEIAPRLRLPDGRAARALLDRVSDQEVRKVVA